MTGTSRLDLYPDLQAYIARLLPKLDQIAADRKQALDRIAAFVADKLCAGETATLTFICTHNSRRSQLSELWAATAATHCGLDGIRTGSGGTETTAFEPRAVAALERAGFRVEDPGGENPRYQVRFAPAAPAQACFSKKYDDPFNPREGFAAIMTCSQADSSCPLVMGAQLRVPLPFEDPKQADGTAWETASYDECSEQIATEMFYLFSRVKA